MKEIANLHSMPFYYASMVSSEPFDKTCRRAQVESLRALRAVSDKHYARKANQPGDVIAFIADRYALCALRQSIRNEKSKSA
jgi:hypothetical protein